MTNMTCNACGWVHFAVMREEAENYVRKFNEFYDAAPEETQRHYTGRAQLGEYLKCSRCGWPHTDFRPSIPGDCPDGCTLSPIIVEGA